MAADIAQALRKIDAAHAEDPNRTTPRNDEASEPYELHYANKMTAYLKKLSPDASSNLQIAVRAQHFRRWEVPRDTYPMTRVGYHAWRGGLKKRQAEQVAALLEQCGFGEDDIARIGVIMRKEGLGKGDDEVQALEDVACLVFLDDQFDEFREKHDEDKIVRILAKTWAKMSSKARDMALDMHMEHDSRRLVEKALSG
ncbi:hypothetical protein K461DRAFT_229155 [Myriangium duriaei CBS 260.36]|uniref:Glutamyl-tRNA synthetase n=1 Tax=Myriangium duriaei CBS 260.36 TaxID=1168546 RepID=A0A9P4IY86_9PEZI|nr:hypothetical protein K461DRAFT_229155 [Myriangium duriaei CBS 260.36]